MIQTLTAALVLGATFATSVYPSTTSMIYSETLPGNLLPQFYFMQGGGRVYDRVGWMRVTCFWRWRRRRSTAVPMPTLL